MCLGIIVVADSAAAAAQNPLPFGARLLPSLFFYSSQARVWEKLRNPHSQPRRQSKQIRIFLGLSERALDLISRKFVEVFLTPFVTLILLI